MKTLYQSHLALKNKEVSSEELTKECLKKARGSQHNAFISLLEDSAIKEAALADKNISKNGIHSFVEGIPYSLKDLFITEGVRTTAGSKMLHNYIPPYDGYISKAFKKAGSVLIGKTNLDEFGMGSTNENSAFGAVKNPHNKMKISGGSSGGSAASIIEESACFSIGSDTGGSARIPANFCGLVALKPSYGTVSRYGQIAYASSLDQASPMSQSVLDLACIMENITIKDDLDETNLNLGGMKIVNELLSLDESYLKGKKIGLSENLIEACDDDVKRELIKALAHFKKMGSEIMSVSLPHLKECIATYYLIAASEASSNLARYTGIHFGFKSHIHSDSLQDSRSAGFGDEVKKRLLFGTFCLSTGFHEAYFKKASEVRRLITEDFILAFKKCDFIFSPVSSGVASDLGAIDQDPMKLYMNDLYTVPASLAGLPALSIPFGKGQFGLPTGFQLIGKPFHDSEIIKIGHSFELSTGRKIL